METVRVERAGGLGPYVFVCDHASSFIPDELQELGLGPAEAREHIAWDIGALPVAQRLSAMLDSPLVYPTVSRLVVDCNRAPEHPELIVCETEFGPVPGNTALDEPERRRRIAAVHDRYHEAVAGVIAARRARGLATTVIAIHSFTPVFRGDRRPWHVGLLHRADDRLARAIKQALDQAGDVEVGLNAPYSGQTDGVFYTLGRHAEDEGLAGVMIELRNDLVRDEAGQALWAERLAAQLGRVAEREEARG